MSAEKEPVIELVDLGEDGLQEPADPSTGPRVSAAEVTRTNVSVKKESVIVGTILLINSEVGSCVLSMPYAISRFGLVFGVIVVVLFALIMYSSMRLLGAVAVRCLAAAPAFQPIDRSSSATPSLATHPGSEVSLEGLVHPAQQAADDAHSNASSRDGSPRSSLSHEDGAPVLVERPHPVRTTTSPLSTTTTPAVPATPSVTTTPSPSPSPSPLPNVAHAPVVARPRVTYSWVANQVAPWSAYLLDFGIILMCFGGIVSYFIIISDTIIAIVNTLAEATTVAAASLSSSSSSSALSSAASVAVCSASHGAAWSVLCSRYFWIAVVFIVAAPLTYVRRIGPLHYLGYINLGCVSYLTIMLIAYACLYRDRLATPSSIPLGPTGASAVSCMTIVVFAYSAQINYFSVFDEILEPQQRIANRSAAGAVCIACVIYLLIGYTGVFITGKDAPSSIIAAFPAAEWFVTVGRFAITANMFTCIPLIFHPLRTCVEGLVEEAEERCHIRHKLSERVRRFSVATVLLLLVVAVAMGFKDLDVVLSLTGSTGGSTVALILPGFLYFKDHPEQRKKLPGIYAVFICAFGVACFVVGVIVTVLGL